MNKLVWISGLTIFVISTFLITNAHNFSSAFGYSKSSNTNHTNSSSGANGTSGNLTKSAATSWEQIFNVASHGSTLPKNCASVGVGMSNAGVF